MCESYNENFKHWKDKYDAQETSWHRPYVMNSMMKFWSKLETNDDSVVFFPLCGKTLDMNWVYEKGLQVVGVDIVDAAAKEFFSENKLVSTIRNQESVTVYESLDKKLNIYIQDVMDFMEQHTEEFDVIVDRGAFVALHPSHRDRYLKLLKGCLKPSGKMFMELLDFDPSEHKDKPPYRVTMEMIESIFVTHGLKHQILHEGDYDKKIAKISRVVERITLVTK